MKRHLLPMLLVAAVSIAIYSNTLKNGFVYDDKGTIVSNAGITKLNNLNKLLNTEYFAISGEMSYRPIVTLTYMFDYALFGYKPWGFHLTNILLHAINGVLLYIFLSLLIEPKNITPSLLNPPLLISILFATNPILTEAVNAVSFREDLLVFLFYMTTLNLYLKLRSKPIMSVKILYSFSCLSYSLALLSKEMAVTLPLLLYCYELTYKDRKSRSLVHVLGYVAITILYAYLRFVLLFNDAENSIERWEINLRILTLPWNLLNYLKITLFPTSLSAYHTINPIKSYLSTQIIYPIGVVVLLMAGFWLRKINKNIAYGFFFFIITLLPVYNIIPIGVYFAERYLYLPTVGISIVAGILLSSFFKPKHRFTFKYFCALIIFFLVVIINSLSVVIRNTVWQNDFYLWSDVLRNSPDSSFTHNNIGLAYAESGRFDEAISHLQKALQLKPNYLDVHTNLGYLYSKQDRLEEAVQEYNYVLANNPSDPVTRNNLAVVYRKQKKNDNAIQELKTAIILDPDDPISHFNMGLIYADQGQYDKAISEYETSLKLRSDYIEAQINLRVALYQRNKKNNLDAKK